MPVYITPSNRRILQRVRRQIAIGRRSQTYDITAYLNKLRRCYYRKLPYRLLYIIGSTITKLIATKNWILQIPHLKDLKTAAVRNSSTTGDNTRPFYVVVPKTFPDIVDLQTYYHDGDHFPPGRCPHDEHWALAPELETNGQAFAFLTDCGATAKNALRNYRKHGIQFRLTE